MRKPQILDVQSQFENFNSNFENNIFQYPKCNDMFEKQITKRNKRKYFHTNTTKF